MIEPLFSSDLKYSNMGTREGVQGYVGIKFCTKDRHYIITPTYDWFTCSTHSHADWSKKPSQDVGGCPDIVQQ